MEALSSSIPQVSAILSKVYVDDIAACALIAIASTACLLRGIAWDKPDPYAHIWYERPQKKLAGTLKNETRDIAEKLGESVGTLFNTLGVYIAKLVKLE